MNKYWATGKNTRVVRNLPNGWLLEYNSAIKMYRLNRSGGKVPVKYMGYTPHKYPLIQIARNYK